LVGREGEILTDDGVEILGFDGVAGGVAVIELVKLALRAASWGRGLMGREFFSAGETPEIGICSFFSSSEVLLSRRRVPALTGEGGFAASRITDLGRYFGSAEVALRFLGRSVEALACAVAWGPLGVSDSLEDCSSEDDLAYVAETRLRVTVLESGVPVLFEPCEGGLTSPMDARGPDGRELRALERRDVSLAFLVFLVASLSLLITSANALPMEARLSDCLKEALVVGLDFRGLESTGIAQKVVVQRTTSYSSFNRHHNLLLFVLVLPHEPSNSFPWKVQKYAHSNRIDYCVPTTLNYHSQCRNVTYLCPQQYIRYQKIPRFQQRCRQQRWHNEHRQKQGLKERLVTS